MTKNTKISIEEMAAFCKRKGFVFPAAEIYGGMAGFFDFGPLGVELKNNIKSSYWKTFVNKRQDMAGQDGSIITNPKVWKASGHVDNFGDLILTTTKTKTKIRADHFIEDKLKMAADGMSAKEIQDLIDKHNLKYNDEDFEEVKDFNLMFSTQVGADIAKSSISYLRPETCQSIFPNFRLIADIERQKLPFGIVQIGKAFRNEISPRDFLFRSREFEQIEMEYFFNPDAKCTLLNDKHLSTKFQFLSAETQDKKSNEMIITTPNDLLKSKKLNEYHAYWIAEFFNYYTKELGLSFENIRIREHVKTELSHYSAGTFDIDYKYPFGFKEMMGIANRTNFDLTQHQNHSKSKLEFYDEETKTKLLPHVIEPSVGVERMMMAILFEAYHDDKERGTVVLHLKEKIAPYSVGVFPLMKKDQLTKVAKEIFNDLLDDDINAFYDESGSIGKRYSRQDEIGTPLNITIDFESIEEGELKDTITIRDRDTTNQKRIKIKAINKTIKDLINNKIKFEDITQ